MASAEVKLWYSLDDGNPVQVGSATVTTWIEDGKVKIDASNLRSLSEEMVALLESSV